MGHVRDPGGHEPSARGRVGPWPSVATSDWSIAPAAPSSPDGSPPAHISVVVHLEVGGAHEESGIAGHLQSEAIGRRPFTGWLGLLSELERLTTGVDGAEGDGQPG